MLRFCTDAENTLDRHRLPMSSMIDVVFLLLVFFVMTFKITSQEGDFAVGGAEATRAGPVSESVNLPLTLRLRAQMNGHLQSIQLNEQRFVNFEQLQAELIELQQGGALHDATMTIDADARLNYQHIIDALDHVTAYSDSAGIKRPLVTATSFASRRE